MSTYKIIGKTNGYIASRDIHFNGNTTITIASGLSHEEAIKKLNEFFFSDYEFAQEINSEIEYVRENFYAKIDEIASNASLSFDEYFQLTQKRWIAYSKLVAKNERFRKYTGAGFYNEGSLIKEKNAESYSFDSRYYSVVEETEEEN